MPGGCSCLLGLALFLGTIVFVQSLLTPPLLVLPVKLKEAQGAAQGSAEQTGSHPAEHHCCQCRRGPGVLQRGFQPRPRRVGKGPAPARTPRPPRPAGQIRLGFTVGWDPSSFDSLTAHADKLTHVCPEWFTVTTSDGNFTGNNDVALQRFLSGKPLVLLPLMTNYAGDGRVPEAVENLAHGPARCTQNLFIDNLKRRLGEIHAGGVLIDWEGIDAAYQDDLTKFLTKIADALHEVGLQLWLQIPVGEKRRLTTSSNSPTWSTFFVAALHDQVSEEDAPGPVAAQDWFELALGHRQLRRPRTMGHLARQLRLRLAAGHRCEQPHRLARADTISFADAMSRAAYAGEGNTQSGSPEYNPSFDYTLAGVNHEVWFLDAVSFLESGTRGARQEFQQSGHQPARHRRPCNCGPRWTWSVPSNSPAPTSRRSST